jgi:branched-subunit amino acid transport protein
MMNGLADLSPYLVLIAAGFLPNEVWRMLGIVVAHGLDEGSQLVIWVRAVATGLLAGVVAKIILFPPGGLADVSLMVRLAAIAIGFAAFLLVRRSVLAGVLAGEAVLIAGAFWLAG